MTRSSHKLAGIPNDVLTSDVIGSRALKVSSETAVDGAVLDGTMHAVNSAFTLAPGETIGFKIRAAGGTFVRFVHADAITVRYVTSFTGLLLSLGSSRSLNQSIDNGYHAYYGRYGNLVFSDDEVILSGRAPMIHGIYSDGDVYIMIQNNSDSIVSDAFSAGLQSVGDFTTPYGIQADTYLTPTTEMSTYD